MKRIWDKFSLAMKVSVIMFIVGVFAAIMGEGNVDKFYRSFYPRIPQVMVAGKYLWISGLVALVLSMAIKCKYFPENKKGGKRCC